MCSPVFTSKPLQSVIGGRGVSRRQYATQARASRYDRRKPPPPDLPSLLFDQRIVYLGMPVGDRVFHSLWTRIADKFALKSLSYGCSGV